MKIDKNLEKRFWDKVDIGAEIDCWEWKAHRSNKGYGRIATQDGVRGAHRVSYEINKGKIGPGMFVCHSCDNPSCVNPAHLWLGTAADNNNDKISKGRCNHNRSPRPRLVSDAQAIEIIKSDLGCVALSKQYGVSAALISLIKRGKIRERLHKK